jgi:hypothetical protein
MSPDCRENPILFCQNIKRLFLFMVVSGMVIPGANILSFPGPEQNGG